MEFDDVATFGLALTRSLDHDPIYPLLRSIIEHERLDSLDAHGLVWWYMAFYNTSSAWLAFSKFGPAPWTARPRARDLHQWEQGSRAQLKINIERRGLRGGQWIDMYAKHQEALKGVGLQAWLEHGLSQNLSGNYEMLWQRLQTLAYVGRWAAFKWLDLLQHVLDYPLEAPDMRMAYCSGPRHALEMLYLGQTSDRQDPPYIEYLDGLGRHLREQLVMRGLPLSWDVLETVLCNFHSLARGRYYVSHDWDEHLQDTLTGAGDPAPWLAARERVASPSVLGEKRGWSGIRKELLRLYREEGVIYRPKGF